MTENGEKYLVTDILKSLLMEAFGRVTLSDNVTNALEKHIGRNYFERRITEKANTPVCKNCSDNMVNLF